MTKNNLVRLITSRYLALTEGREYAPYDKLEGMLLALNEHAYIWPFDKSNRWIGFIQGVLWINGDIDLTEEQNFTRPIFNQHYKDLDLKIPKSADIQKVIE